MFKEYLKYLIGLLLIFSISVNEPVVVINPNSNCYYQISNVDYRREFDISDSRLLDYNQQLCFADIPTIFYTKYIRILDQNTSLFNAILKIQIQIHRQINLFINKNTFLNKRTTSKYSNFSLYSV